MHNHAPNYTREGCVAFERNWKGLNSEIETQANLAAKKLEPHLPLLETLDEIAESEKILIQKAPLRELQTLAGVSSFTR